MRCGQRHVPLACSTSNLYWPLLNITDSQLLWRWTRPPPLQTILLYPSTPTRSFLCASFTLNLGLFRTIVPSTIWLIALITLGSNHTTGNPPSSPFHRDEIARELTHECQKEMKLTALSSHSIICRHFSCLKNSLLIDHL